MTHWKLWECEVLVPPAPAKESKIDSPDRRQMRRLCEGRLTEGNSGSRRWARRWAKREKAAAARIAQGLLPRMLRP